MGAFNKVLLMGNLTRDPELRVTNDGLSICKFGLAVTRKYKDKEETTFVDIDSFGSVAEVISKYFSKGKPIFVEGRLKLDQWEDKESGQKRSKLSVVLESFQFVGGNDGSSSGANQESEGSSNGPDDDIPF